MEILTQTRPGLSRLIDGIRPALHAGDPHRIATAVAEVLRARHPRTDILTEDERRGSEAGIGRVYLHTEEQFSIQAVIWRPGQETRIHDHIAWCAFAVLQGVEEETLYRDDGDHLTLLGQSVNGTGAVSGFAPPGDIHKVRNPGNDTAITLHVYGTDLGGGRSSVQRTYDLPVRTRPART
ncbi:cysteine dioxygenase family protein [Nocardia sp. XZ_19_385]|uniref:cysteine dioxygenase family protein n=1 Tax=Nocardia sp. XZ_19_385 TaxID=2769488 RepID=UPI001E414956|nr:cysteine dioxygenase family protein [Nocardia sp. XZ_19_385]